METKGRKRKISNEQDNFEEDSCKLSNKCSTFHSDGINSNQETQALEGQNISVGGPTQTDSLQQKQSKSKKYGNLLDGIALGHVTELWDKLYTLQESLKTMSWSEGLKPLKNFASLNELLSLGGDKLINDLVTENIKINSAIDSVKPLLNEDGTCKSVNYEMQPVIGVVYGPTGSGKSQLLRNLLSCHLINPAPETIFFIVPHIEMIPPQEFSAWEIQICEGNYEPGIDDTIVPRSGSLMPKFIKMSYDDFTAQQNYDISDPNNVFAAAAAKGPIAIIMDECMENLGSHKGISQFFHAFPSKLHNRFPKCTGYTVIVVLHNMNPRKDHSGNISTLKIQSKLHILSPKMQPAQIIRFINTYTKGLPLAINLLLKDIFHYHNLHSSFDWIIYNTCPENEALQWMYLHPKEGLIPMYLNIQCMLYEILLKIHRVISDRERWNKYYHRHK
ncbi:IVa2 [Mastadenovirus eidoli]|uniref:Packaging protein 1 n=1 Tax=Eidolon helvum adenovirus TaxID=2039267 RepID=A0A348FKF8_9ADEN|nr:IVa2 [Eidolon helvum adenovirus]BBF72825.1 IVa2 [Eidolon helvum adenovirus]